MTSTPPNHALHANPAGASRLQPWPPVRRVAELGSLGIEIMNQSITLNLPYDLNDEEWAKIRAVYESMDEWQSGQALPCWFGALDSPQNLAASVEPSGLLIEGELDLLLFRGWITKLCAKLTAALGREVYDAEV